MFRVNIPGIGNVFISTPDPNAALASARSFAASRGLGSTDIAAITEAIPVSAASLTPDATIIDQAGNVIGGGVPITPPSDPDPITEPIDGPEIGTGLDAPTLLAPSTQFRQFLRSRGVDPDSFAGRRAGRFQGGAQSIFDIGTATGLFGPNATTPDANNPFQQVLNTGLLNTLGSNAQGAFRRLLSEDTPSSEQVDLLRTAAPGSGDVLERQAAANLQQLAELALGGATNLGFANRFGAGLVNRAVDRFQERADLDPTNQETFAQFLNRRLRLGVA